MPIYTLRDTDPKGQLYATQDEGETTSSQFAKVLSTLVNSYKAKKLEDQNKAFRLAAMQELGKGASEVSYDYDPTTGQIKFKIEPKKQPSMSELINRYRTGQQFGVDPVTGQAIPDENLRDPRFGYDPFGIAAAAALNSPDDENMDETLPVVSKKSSKKTTPKVTMPQDPGGGVKFLDPKEHYNQLREAGYSKEEARKLAGV